MRRYSIWLFLWTAACSLTIGAFNFFVDPYGIFDTPRIEGVNAIKSRAGQREGLVKKYRIYSLRPNAIILGNSRAQVGFDPLHRAWPSDARPVLNLAVPGAGPQTARDLLGHATTAGALNLIVIGVDFVDFRLHSSAPPQAYVSHAVQPPDLRTRLQDYVSVTMSLDALVDSLLTVQAQGEPYRTSLTPEGFNPMLDYIGHAKREGYAALFAQRDAENAKSYLKGGNRVIHPATGTSPEFEAIRDMLRQARRSRARVHLVIYPYHAHILELFDLAGLWGPFEDWKRELVRLVESEGRQSGSTISLWDFSGYNAFTSEAVPEVGDTHNIMQWYWEAGHFKKELGDIVLDRILDQMSQTQSGAERFGMLLSRQDIESHLRSIRLARTEYRRERQSEVVRLRRLVEQIAGP
jgi:hypothetical protein